MVVERRLDALDRLTHQRRDIDRLAVKREGAGLNSRHVEQRGDQSGKALGLAADDLEGVHIAWLRLAGAQSASLKHLAIADHRRLRCLQLVGGDREKIVTRANRRLSI